MVRTLTALASLSLLVACGGPSGPDFQSAQSLDAPAPTTRPAAARPAVALPVGDTSVDAGVAPVSAASPDAGADASAPDTGTADAGVSPAPVPAAPSLQVHLTTDSSTEAWASDFDISSTYDVYFATDLTGDLQGHLSLALDVFMPGNGAYETFTTAIAVGVPAADGEVQAERTASGAYRVWSRMPVAGTIIDQYSLSGPWTATAYLGDLSSTVGFNLN